MNALQDIEAADELWVKEADARYEAYKRGELKTAPAEEVLGKAFDNLK